MMGRTSSWALVGPLCCLLVAGGPGRADSPDERERERRLSALAALAPEFRAPSPEGAAALLSELVRAFDLRYARLRDAESTRGPGGGDSVYFLRRRLPALLDMWRATGERRYLAEAHRLTREAIRSAEETPCLLLRRGENRGSWPCFFSESLVGVTGGHSMLLDLQGSAGFLMVARALREAGRPGWQAVSDFVASAVLEKWLIHYPAETRERHEWEASKRTLISRVNNARDQREHFAAISLDLADLGHTGFPYRDWGEFLIRVYLGSRESLEQRSPLADELGSLLPNDWGVIPTQEGMSIWYWGSGKDKRLAIPDTSHANRTLWLATKAYELALISRPELDRFIAVLKFRVWNPGASPFAFRNFVDGSDDDVGGLTAGRAGNVWFGWHRLAAYDADLRALFVALAVELARGGRRIPQSQNRDMQNAPLCLIAWGARLLSSQGVPAERP